MPYPTRPPRAQPLPPTPARPLRRPEPAPPPLAANRIDADAGDGLDLDRATRDLLDHLGA